MLEVPGLLTEPAVSFQEGHAWVAQHSLEERTPRKLTPKHPVCNARAAGTQTQPSLIMSSCFTTIYALVVIHSCCFPWKHYLVDALRLFS